MSYTSIVFFIFVAAVTLIYFLFPSKKYQWTVLLAASYFFYCYMGYRLVFFILLTTVTTWLAGMKAESVREASAAELKAHKGDWDRAAKKAFKQKTQSKQRRLLAAVLILNFGILVFLKYYNFMAGGLNSLLGSQALPILKLLLPLGISFYTFQSMGYMIDVFRGNISAEKKLFRFALFISFFPQIIQGPISAYSQLAAQLYEPHRPEYLRFKYGLELILWGYFKKLVIADRAVTAINTVTADYSAYTGTTILFVSLLYALQLYADFSAGIDISRGIAQMLGIDMAVNFRRPYFSRSINEYWRRWHITLGVWMKNYIFYPVAMSGLFLGAGKRMKKSAFGQTKAGAHISKVLPTSVASLIVFLVVGLWHGANGKYVAFGLWNGLIIMLSIVLKPVFENWITALHIRTESFGWRLFQMVRTFIIVLIGYYFDIAPDFAGAVDMIRRSIVDQHLGLGKSEILSIGLKWSDYFVLAVGLIIIWIVSIRQEKLKLDGFGELISRRRTVFQWLCLFCMIMLIIIWGIYGPGYDPADFVYMQF